MSHRDPSILVIGAGVFGTSTAYHLKKTHPSWKVTVVDQASSPPDLAASSDINKIIRADYSIPLYSELAYEAIEAWQSWPSLKPYYHRTGWVAFDEQDSDFAERVRSVFKERGHDPTADVPLQELDHKWAGCLRGTNTKGFKDAYWNPEAGWCDAAKATASLMSEAITLGVHYVCSEVEKVFTDGFKALGVRLKSGEILEADQTVLATGAWTSALLSSTEDELDISDSNRIERQAQAAGVAVAHFKMTDTEMQQLAEMPVVVYGGNGEVIPPAEGYLKFTNVNTFTHMVVTASGRRISVPPKRNQNILSVNLQRETEELMMNRVMPTFARGKKADYWRICWDARTESQDWLLAQHPEITGLYFAIGGSFHSYKFLPNIGIYMTNVINGKGNGSEKDSAWGWKESTFSGRGAHESTKPTRDLKDLED